jgi:epoxyqueuosine reductase
MLERQIKQLAISTGFDLVGFTPAKPPAHLDVFLAWIREKHHAGMKYMSSDRAIWLRSDPRNVLPGAKSIIVLGARYHNSLDVQDMEIDICTGRMASYAWDIDYHQLLTEKMNQMIQKIMQVTGKPFGYKFYTDSGPILERDFAQSAGLGWIGKNSCLISPHKGSFLFLAEILTDLELEPDLPFTNDFCGSCQRCIQACPTQCILPNRTIDSSRCISYLTIENKGEIPRNLRKKISNWIFGCDICQNVCPWNQKTNRDSYISFFHTRKDIILPDLRQEMQLSPQAFRLKFSGSPVLRAKYRGYLRNVVCALGNTHDPSAVPVLGDAMQTNPEALVRQHAAWVLSQIPTAQTRAMLEGQLLHEDEPKVISEIHMALQQLS